MSEDQDLTALCPKCGEQLTYVTSVPHPKSPAMQRTTFVCYPCNRTWSYALAPAMAEAYAASAAPAAGVGKIEQIKPPMPGYRGRAAGQAAQPRTPWRSR